MIRRSQVAGRAAQVLWGMLGRSTGVNKMCQNLNSGDRYFILAILLPLPRNKPCVVAPKRAPGPCRIGAWGALVLQVRCVPGFPSPWTWRGSTAFSPLLSPVSCLSEEERALIFIRAESSSFECNCWNAQGSCVKKGDFCLALTPLTPALQTWPDFLNLKSLTVITQE